MKYMLIIEKGESSYGAYVPDLQGCLAAGETESEVRELIQEAISFHIEALIEDGEKFPPPSSEGFFIDVTTAA